MQKAIEIRSQGLTLRGMLHLPDQVNGKIPIVIIFHGFAGNKMASHFMFVKLSRLLEKKGIASVRFDFGGSGESDGDFIDMTLSGELVDAKNILEYVKGLNFIDKDRIAAVGLSMGGAVASMLAGENKDDIHSLCLWAPAGNMGEIVINDFIGDNFTEFNQKGYLDFEGLLMGEKFVEDLENINIYKKAADFDKDVLLIHGDNDTVVPLSTSEKYLFLYGEKSELIVINKGDHTFNKKEWEEEVLEYTVEFFEKELIYNTKTIRRNIYA